MIHSIISRKLLAVGAIAALMGLASCSSTTSTTPPTPSVDTSKYMQKNLVSDTVGYNTTLPNDPSLINAWGISVNPTAGIFWLSSNHGDGGSTVIYDGLGATKLPAIKVPSRNGTDDGSPTGVVFNGTADFNGNKFIYCTEDGIIAAWNGTMSKVATSSSPTAVYKGMAVATNGGNQFLYVANFFDKKVDVYDKTFQQSSSITLSDPSIPSGFSPFNIANIGGMLYVSYAKQHTIPDADDQSGPGNGYIDIFQPDGTFVKRFVSSGVLNSPWGMTQAPATFGGFSNAILVGNFGDGAINAFDASGNLIGPMNDASGKAIKIPGLWGLMSFGSSAPGIIIANSVYFTAGPSDEDHGLFGYIKMQ